MNMNNEGITNIFLKANNRHRIKGRSDSMTELLPFFIMDECYDLYRKYIKDISCCYNLKKIRNTWRDGWSNFNKSFTSCYNEIQRDYIFDKMDDFDRYINEDIETLIENVKKGLATNDVAFQYRQGLAVCLICNVLASASQIQWNNTYVDRKGNPEINMDIQKVEKATIKFAEAYYRPMKNIDLNKFPLVEEAVNSLCRKMVDWLYKDVTKEKKVKLKIESWCTWRLNHHYTPKKNVLKKFAPISKTLEDYGYESVGSMSGNNLFAVKKAGALSREIIYEQKNTQISDYEYVYYGAKSAKPTIPDTLIVYRKRREDII